MKKTKKSAHIGNIMRKAKVHIQEDVKVYSRKRRKKLQRKELNDEV